MIAFALSVAAFLFLVACGAVLFAIIAQFFDRPASRPSPPASPPLTREDWQKGLVYLVFWTYFICLCIYFSPT